MPPFQYQPYVNQLAPTIAELMAHQNDPYARAAVESAQANARAREVSGQAWGRAAENIGQIPNQIIQQRDAETVRRQREQEMAQRTAQMQRQQLGEKVSALIAANAETTEDGHLRYNVKSFLESVKSDPALAAFAHEPADAMTKANDSYQTWVEGRTKTREGALQDIFAKTSAAGGTADDLQVIAAPYIKAGVLKVDDFTPMITRLQSVPDEAARLKLLRAAGSVKPEYKETPAGGTLSAIYPGAAPETVLATPEKKSLETKPDMVIKGTSNVPTFNPANGEWSFGGKPVAADQIEHRVAPKDPIAVALQNMALENAKQNLSDKQRRANDVTAIADGMSAGTIPPDPEGLQRSGIYGDAVAELQKRGVNFNELRQQYLAQKRLISTENSPQGVRLDIAVRSGNAMYDKVDELSDQWQGMGLGLLSRANLKAATEGLKGPKAQELATQLVGQIAQLTSDVATVEQNGMTPTEESRKVAEKSLQSWWGDGTIKKMTAQGRANMNIRDAARRETVPLVPGATQTPSTGKTYQLVNGKWVLQ